MQKRFNMLHSLGSTVQVLLLLLVVTYPGGMWILSTPPKTAAANFERNGFQTRYSIFSPFVYCERKLTKPNKNIVILMLISITSV